MARRLAVAHLINALMTKSLIIFDMDGTLIDSSRLLANAINYVRGKLALPPMPPQYIIAEINNHQHNPARFFYETDQFEPIHEEWFGEYYTAHHHEELQLYDGIRELLIVLKEQGRHLAVATNAYRSSTIESLRALEIEHFFDAVVCQDDVANPKPAPEMLYRILDRLQTPKENAIFIGDGPRDEEAAQAAGIDYIMVDWGFTDHHDRAVVKSVEELARILLKP